MAGKSATGQFVGLVFFTPYNRRVKPFGRNPSRAVYPRKVVVRKITPTINARRQPEQVTITGSGGELIICPANFMVLRENVGLKASEFKRNCKSLDEHACRRWNSGSLGFLDVLLIGFFPSADLPERITGERSRCSGEKHGENHDSDGDGQAAFDDIDKGVEELNE